MARLLNACDDCGSTYFNKGSGKRMRKFCPKCKVDKQDEFEKKVISVSKGEELK